jgi:hypothetical protein
MNAGRDPRWGVLVALLGLGCASDKNYALVSVLSSLGPFNDVAQLLVEVDNGSYQDFLTYPRTQMGTYRFDEVAPLTFSVSFRSSSHSGTLEIRVTTLDATGGTTGYGSGTAEIDGENVTYVSVRVVRGAEPAPPRDGGVDAPTKQDVGPPCDPTNAASACGADKTCIVGCRSNGTSGGMCVMAGNKAPGAACNDDCVQGAECFKYSCTAGVVRACLRLCKDDSECGQGRCNLQIPCGSTVTPYRSCSQPCDPVGPATSGCAAGLSCFVFAGEIPDCDCPGGKRSDGDGVPCTNSDTCQAGFLCVSMAGAKSCRPLCRLAAPQCEAGRTCTKLIDPDYQTYGACLP